MLYVIVYVIVFVIVYVIANVIVYVIIITTEKPPLVSLRTGSSKYHHSLQVLLRHIADFIVPLWRGYNTI
jgi:hypothetical protein